MKICLIYLLVLLFFINKVYSQIIYNTKELTTSNGLASNFIYDLEFDHKGKLWIATDKGINVYNGKKCFTYNTKNSTLLNDYIKELVFIDSCLYVKNAKSKVSAYYVDASFTLLNSTSDVNFNFKSKKEKKVKLSKNKIDAILADLGLVSSEVNLFLMHENFYWIGTKGMGLFQIENKGVKLLDSNYNNELILQFNKKHYYSKDNRFINVNNNQKSLGTLNFNDAILSITTIQNDTIYIGENGLFDSSNKEPFLSIKKITHRLIMEIH